MGDYCSFTREDFELLMYGAWYISFNDALARELYETIPLGPGPAAVRCCPFCSDIWNDRRIGTNFPATLADMSIHAESCSICKILLRASKSYHNNNDQCISLKRTRSALTAGRGGPRLLRFSTGLVTSGNSIGAPVGLPVSYEPHHPAQFQLLRAWLRHCDKSHNCNQYHGEPKIVFPTRVLYVGDPRDPGYNFDSVRLVFASETTRQEYIALSHCWGDLSVEEKKLYCTTQDNIGQRLEGFSIFELPKTFQDAIEVTRELGALYLWIDSLCIIQYGDDGKDWKYESGRMESVFSSAYCTIAANSAVDSNAGFLERHVSSEYVYVQNASGEPFYISTNIDNFDDVDSARLNTRAWIMQERVLARRTIHFSAHQTYWECGFGIHCENLTILKSKKSDKYFKLDPQFPKRLIQSGNRRTVNFITSLFQDYSKRSPTVLTDRCVAISGLEDRIKDVLNCKSRYGIFQKYLHRNLLWKASEEKVKKIAYEHHVPSWSWMAYSGGIQFMNIPFNTVDWIDNLRFDEECECDHAIVSNVWKFENCMIELHGALYKISDSDGMPRGWVQYDVEAGEELDKEGCIVVGRIKDNENDALGIKKYYILVVRPTSVDAEYKRVGIGLIQIEYLVSWGVNVRIV